MTSMEAPLYGVPVLTVNASQHFTNKNFTFDANSYDEFIILLKKLISGELKLDKLKQNEANRYFYFYHKFLPNNFPIHVALPRYSITEDNYYLDRIINLANILNGTIASILKITENNLKLIFNL